MKLFFSTASAALISAMIGLNSSNAETLKDKKQKAVGFIAQTLCSQRRYDYDKFQIQKKISLYANTEGKEIHDFLKEPEIIKASNTLSLSMTPNCTGFNQNSESFKKAMALIGDL